MKIILSEMLKDMSHDLIGQFFLNSVKKLDKNNNRGILFKYEIRLKKLDIKIIKKMVCFKG